MDFFSLIEELIEVVYADGTSKNETRTILNKDQARKFMETTIMDYLYNLKEEDLPALRAAIRMARD